MTEIFRPDAAGKLYSQLKGYKKVWWFCYVSMEPRVIFFYTTVRSHHAQEAWEGHKLVCTLVKFNLVASMLSKTIPTDSSCYNDSEKVKFILSMVYHFVVIDKKGQRSIFWLYSGQIGNSAVLEPHISPFLGGPRGIFRDKYKCNLAELGNLIGITFKKRFLDQFTVSIKHT